MDEEKKNKGKNPPPTIIIPVYRDVKMTVDCIQGAIKGAYEVPGAEVLVINDCSPESGMKRALEQLKKEHKSVVRIHENNCNLGYTKSVNTGLGLTAENDVVLLNSDAKPTHSTWLKRLRNDAYSQEKIATATPMSSNTEICSFPNFMAQNTEFQEHFSAETDDHFSQSVLPLVESPTGIGFCMYIKRSAIDRLGGFDESNFPIGYGEENDFCQRVISSGMSNVISANVFVDHKGGMSFGKEKAALVENAREKVAELHPEYQEDIHHFIWADPLRAQRIFRHLDLMARSRCLKTLHVTHGLGGGVKKNVLELSKHLRECGGFSLILEPAADGSLTLNLNDEKTCDKITFEGSKKVNRLVNVLKFVGISHVHYHHMMNVPNEILSVHLELNCPAALTFHDFYMICGNPTLTDENGKFTEDETSWLANRIQSTYEEEDPSVFRKRSQDFIDTVEIPIFPSRSTLRLIQRYLNIDNPVVVPHIETSPMGLATGVRFCKNNLHNICALGALNVEKGAGLLRDVAKRNYATDRELNFILVGYSNLPLDHVDTTGPYNDEELPDILARKKAGILFFPAQCPETYSYTLSAALRTNLPIIAPSIGAFPERLSGRRNTLIFDHSSSPVQILMEIKSFIADIKMDKPRVSPTHSPPLPSVSSFYDDEYVANAKICFGSRADYHSILSLIPENEMVPPLANQSKFAAYLWKLTWSTRFRFVRKKNWKWARTIARFLLIRQ